MESKGEGAMLLVPYLPFASGLKMNPYLEANARRRNAEALSVNAPNRLD